MTMQYIDSVMFILMFMFMHQNTIIMPDEPEEEEEEMVNYL